MTAPAPTKAGRGTLYVIAGMLLASGVIRIGGDAGQAIAKGLDGAEPAQVAQTAETCRSEEDLAVLLGAISAREDRVADRETQLRDRIQALSVAEAQVTQKLAELKEAESSLESTLAIAQTAAQDDLSALTQVYENMKPKDAAALFEEMAPEFAAGFLGRMKPDAAAEILAGLQPRSAYTISVLMAGRNANVATE